MIAKSNKILSEKTSGRATSQNNFTLIQDRIVESYLCDTYMI